MVTFKTPKVYASRFEHRKKNVLVWEVLDLLVLLRSGRQPFARWWRHADIVLYLGVIFLPSEYSFFFGWRTFFQAMVVWIVFGVIKLNTWCLFSVWCLIHGYGDLKQANRAVVVLQGLNSFLFVLVLALANTRSATRPARRCWAWTSRRNTPSICAESPLRRDGCGSAARAVPGRKASNNISVGSKRCTGRW